jgi:integrase
LELNAELHDLSAAILKEAHKLREDQIVVSKNDYKKILIGAVDRDNIPKDDDDLKSLIRQFKTYKAIYSTDGTMKEYNTVFKALDDYQTKIKERLTLLDFNEDFYISFEAFLSKKKNPKDETRGLLNDTIYKYISTLKVFLSWCNEQGHIVHPDTFKKHKSAFKRKTHNEIVVLTEDELNMLYEYDLSAKPSYERVRDLFCFACFTGQRYSDIMRFNKSDFKDNRWTFLSSKTKKKVTVPFNGFIARGLDILLSTLSKVEINAQKTLMSKSLIKVRHPYDRKPKLEPRRASIWGSTNKDEFLTDETGSVRWLCFNVLDIDFSYKSEIDINLVWSQAYQLYKSDFKMEMTSAEIQENEKANRHYKTLSAEAELLHKYYAPATADSYEKFLTATEITSNLITLTESKLRINPVEVGKALKMLGFTQGQRRGHGTQQFPVKGYYLYENPPTTYYNQDN